MTKYYFKPVSIILTFLLIISVFMIAPISASATAGDLDDPYVLTDSVTYHVNYEGSTNSYYFTASDNGVVSVCSSGNYDTYGYLLNDSEDELASDDDSGGNSNYKITYTVEANHTYIVSSRLYNTDSSGEFDVTIEYVPEYSYSNDGTNATITAYNGSDSDILIPSEIDGYTVTAIGDNAFNYNYNLTSVTIPETVKRIGNSAFNSCSNLLSVTLGSGLESVGNYAFEYCYSLKKIVLQNSDTTIGEEAFMYCARRLSIVGYIGSTAHSYALAHKDEGVRFVDIEVGIQEFDYTLDANSLATITNYNGSLTDVSIPAKIDGYSVVAIGESAFAYNSTITSVTIPTGVTSVGDSAFANCYNLTSVTLPNTLKNIGDNAFYYCNNSNLTKIEIPSGVTSIGDYAFGCCYGIEEVSIPNTVTTIGDYAFYFCSNSNFNELLISESVENIGDYAFGYCYSLDSVTILSRFASINSSAFYGCPNNMTIKGYTGSTAESFINDNNYTYTFVAIDDSNTDFEYTLDANNNATITAYNGTDTEVEIPSQVDGYTVTAINGGTFSGCADVTSIIIPDSVTTLYSGALSGCSNLKSLTFGNGITSIGSYSFTSISSLESVTFGEGITSIGAYAFAGCSNLKTAIIPRSVTNMGSGVFISSSNLTIYGYDGSCADTYASSQSPAIPFVPMFNTNKGDSYEGDVLTGTQSRDGADASFGINKNSYQNFELLGVQRKIDRGSTDMRFVAVINDGIINDESVADYGFVVAKTDYTTTAQATDSFISKVTLGAANTVKRSCKGTVNSFSGIYGRIDTATKYKYLTLAIENVPDNQGFVVRFYLKTKSGKVFYANYITDYTGCVTSYANLNSLVA